MNLPKIVGKVELPEAKPTTYKCTCCGKFKRKVEFNGFTWGQYVCSECEYDEIEGEQEFMRAEGRNRNLSEDECIIYNI
jgi:hypothetical protein